MVELEVGNSGLELLGVQNLLINRGGRFKPERMRLTKEQILDLAHLVLKLLRTHHWSDYRFAHKIVRVVNQEALVEVDYLVIVFDHRGRG